MIKARKRKRFSDSMPRRAAMYDPMAMAGRSGPARGNASSCRICRASGDKAARMDWNKSFCCMLVPHPPPGKRIDIFFVRGLKLRRGG